MTEHICTIFASISQKIFIKWSCLYDSKHTNLLSETCISFWVCHLLGMWSWTFYFVHPESVQFSSLGQSCLTLCDPINCSMPGFPIHHQLPELAQTYVSWVSSAIQPSHPPSSPYWMMMFKPSTRKMGLITCLENQMQFYTNINTELEIWCASKNSSDDMHKTDKQQGFITGDYVQSVQFSLVTHSCLTLCNPMDCSTPGDPVHHQSPEFALMPIELVIPLNHLILCHPPFLLLSIFPSIWVFSNESHLHQRAKVLGYQLQHQSFQWTPRTDFLYNGVGCHFLLQGSFWPWDWTPISCITGGCFAVCATKDAQLPLLIAIISEYLLCIRYFAKYPNI